MLPVGPLIDSVATLSGALIGAALGHKIPDSLKKMLPLTFGAASMAMGVVMINKVHILPAVILALLLGAILGELFKIEGRIEFAAKRIQGPIQRLFKSENTQIDEQVMLVMVISHYWSILF